VSLPLGLRSLVQATVDYEVEIVDEIGNGILKIGAEVRNGRLTVPLEKLTRGSYWVRVYRTQPDRQVVAEYGARRTELLSRISPSEL
jgi:hypothetical protein